MFWVKQARLWTLVCGEMLRCPTVPNSGVLVGNAGFRAVFTMRWWRIVPWLETHGCYTVEIGFQRWGGVIYTVRSKKPYLTLQKSVWSIHIPFTASGITASKLIRGFKLTFSPRPKFHRLITGLNNFKSDTCGRTERQRCPFGLHVWDLWTGRTECTK